MTAGFWVLEGIDGCGKSTQAARLVARLRREGQDPLHLREPGSTALGEGLRRLLLEPGRSDWEPRAEALVFFAARQELLCKEIAPALAAGRPVVCERFTASTYAYQGQSEADAAWILALDRLVVGDAAPSRYLILDLDPRESYARVGRDMPRDAFETRGLAFQEEVRARYLAFAAAVGDHAAVIPVGGRSPEEVEAAIAAALVEARA